MSKETTRCIIKHVNNKSQSSQGSFASSPLVSALHDSPTISKGSGASLSLSIQSSESHTNMSSSDMQDSDAHGTLQSSKTGRIMSEIASRLFLHVYTLSRLLGNSDMRNPALMTIEGLFLASTQLTPRPLGELREASTPSATSIY